MLVKGATGHNFDKIRLIIVGQTDTKYVFLILQLAMGLIYYHNLYIHPIMMNCAYTILCVLTLAEFFLSSMKNFALVIISQLWDDTGPWNPSQFKAKFFETKFVDNILRK